MDHRTQHGPALIHAKNDRPGYPTTLACDKLQMFRDQSPTAGLIVPQIGADRGGSIKIRHPLLLTSAKTIAAPGESPCNLRFQPAPEIVDDLTHDLSYRFCEFRIGTAAERQ